MVLLRILCVTLVSVFLFTSVSGRCTNPKVRREWRSLCADERAAWINAVKCLASLPHDPKIAPIVDPTLSLIPPLNPDSSYFDDIVYTHMDLNVLIHNTGFFLPWHRLYVQALEDGMRLKCGYDGVQPYWDWTKDTSDIYHSTVFSDSDYDGLGSWGDPDNDFQLCTGGFKDMVVAYPVPHRVRRNYTAFPYFPPGFPVPVGVPPLTAMLNTTFTSEIVNTIVNSTPGDYISFQASLENGPHPGPHLVLGGEMGGICPFGSGPPECVPGPKWSPNDPMFFLHHAMVDRIWYEWQQKNSSNQHVFAGGTVSWQVNASVILEYPTGAPPLLNTSSVVPSDGLWNTTTVGEVLDTTGGRLCYVYA
ncbi:Di-copper centre-containing protein [Thelephora terrestris]|uniref:Di-copper centre-containing protein n=1 Tax=Thelephora terrestris TaxID=56493 RepID=A0A9P6HES9_9AGAM|nr:Di-copper centre-containing protein [Thelephora terrestris]